LKNWDTNSIQVGESHFLQLLSRLGYRGAFHLQFGSSHLDYPGFGADCAVNLRVMEEALNIQLQRVGPFSHRPSPDHHTFT
jgi:hypothetical protein